jgi:hypothetical protein
MPDTHAAAILLAILAGLAITSLFITAGKCATLCISGGAVVCCLCRT